MVGGCLGAPAAFISKEIDMTTKKEQVRVMITPIILNEAGANARDLNIPLSAYVEAAVAAYNQNSAARSVTNDPNDQ